ncbi:MAG: hypothetical protein ISR82_02915 [Candidatus Marinimicrobia bacterium]|nr:hypothetical protein [Candidatus Neomarinimicrobiota bacterium]MBL7010153.1 hypothetical protein [Candidatus Neomarinimicrobiota bacterium]MBL7030418.1 hypothetical protein [Candidatus Neomarinimicrobiota bacterium]
MHFSFLHETDLILWVILFMGVGLTFFLYKILSNERWYQLLLSIRAIVLLLLIILLLNPVLNFSGEKEKELKWAIFVDNSASIKYHQTPSIHAIQSGINSLTNRLTEKNIPYDLYQFADKINKLNGPNLEGKGVTTNLGIVSEKIIQDKNDLAGAVIISDGLITEGKNPLREFQQLNFPVHTIGIGEGSELVDVAIQSIDVPTVVLKSDGVNVNVTVQSLGNISDRLSVSLYASGQLLGSKHIRLSGLGSKKEINFRFRPKDIGKQNYEVRVSSVEDEINIQNNRQQFNILVLKDRYKVALLTGSPNKNTGVLKRMLNQNPRIHLDHFVRMTETRFRPGIKSFWETPYELIIFENYPIKPLSSNFVRILGKKVLSNQAALFLISGPNQSNASLKGITSILGVTILDTIIETKSVFWDFTDEKLVDDSELPPLLQNIYMTGQSSRSDTLAITEMDWPLWIRNQHGNIRTMVWTSPGLNTLYSYEQKLPEPGAFSFIWLQSISWLLKTGGEHENFFRLNKDRFQQGEMVQISGNQPFEQSSEPKRNVMITLFHDSNEILMRDILFNIEEQRWMGEFRAPGPGEYQYSIHFELENEPIQTGSFQVLESQIELNQVFLNKKLLTSISNETDGQYLPWASRDSLLIKLNPKVRREFKANIIKFNESKILLFIIILLLCIEWIIRRRRGLT